MIPLGNGRDRLLRRLVASLEAGRAFELRKDRHLVADQHMGPLAAAQEIVVANARVGVRPRGRLVHVVQRRCRPDRINLLGRDVQFTVADADLHVQPVPVRIVGDAAQPELALPPVAQVLNPPAHHAVSAVDGVLDGAELLALRQPGQQAQRLDGIALAGSVGADQHRQRAQRQPCFAEALEVFEGEGGEHGRSGWFGPSRTDIWDCGRPAGRSLSLVALLRRLIRWSTQCHPHSYQHLAGADITCILLVQVQVGGGVDHQASTAVAHWKPPWKLDEVPVTILPWVRARGANERLGPAI